MRQEHLRVSSDHQLWFNLNELYLGTQVGYTASGRNTGSHCLYWKSTLWEMHFQCRVIGGVFKVCPEWGGAAHTRVVTGLGQIDVMTTILIRMSYIIITLKDWYQNNDVIK